MEFYLFKDRQRVGSHSVEDIRPIVALKYVIFSLLIATGLSVLRADDTSAKPAADSKPLAEKLAKTTWRLPNPND